MGLVVIVCIGLLFILAAIGAIANAAGSSSARARSGTSVGGDVALAVVSAIIVAGCVGWSIHLEHRLRGKHPVAAAYQPARRYRGPVPRAVRRRGRYGPGVVAFQTAVLTLVFIGLVIGVLVVHGEAARSADVQAHGIPATGTVVSVHNHTHHGKSSTWYTSDVEVTISPPVLGRSTTVVRYPGQYLLPPGTPVPVLVDRHDPGYAEFPGSPDTKDSDWIVLAVFATIAGGFVALLAIHAVRLLRHRRSVLRPGGPAAPASLP